MGDADAHERPGARRRLSARMRGRDLRCRIPDTLLLQHRLRLRVQGERRRDLPSRNRRLLHVHDLRPQQHVSHGPDLRGQQLLWRSGVRADESHGPMSAHRELGSGRRQSSNEPTRHAGRLAPHPASEPEPVRHEADSTRPPADGADLTPFVARPEKGACIGGFQPHTRDGPKSLDGLRGTIACLAERGLDCP